MARLQPAVVVILALGLASAGAARAEGSASVAAQALFEEGHAALERKDYATACPKLEESQRLEPKNGTLLNLATCHLGAGRTATAWVELKEGLSQATREGRAANAQYAREQLALVEPRLSRLTITAKEPSPELEVTIDGAKLGSGALGAALPIDPGAHRVAAAQPGHVAWSTPLDVPAGPWAKTIEIPVLARVATTEVSGADEGGSRSRMTPWVWTLGGVAVASAGLGAYFGLRALSKNHGAEAQCPDGRCVGDGLELDRQARSSATISTVAFGVAVAAAAGAIVIYATGDTSKRPVSIGVGPGGVALAAAF